MPSKQSKKAEVQLLELLKSILPKAVPDLKLVEQIYSACEQEITAKTKVAAFEKYCSKTALPDLEKTTVAEIQKQFEDSFGKGNVSIVTHPSKEAATVEVVMPDGVLEGILKVNPNSGAEIEGGEEEFKPKWVAFPVALESDPELVWQLGRSETMTTQEGAIALAKAQDDFWESKAGLKLQKERVEKSFSEFISRVPSKLLTEVGLKRHYKDPEAIKQLNRIAKLKNAA
ncbi:MAG: hypothetical protein ACO1QB_10285 [Verrucomicrobiales bacterium]